MGTEELLFPLGNSHSSFSLEGSCQLQLPLESVERCRQFCIAAHAACFGVGEIATEKDALLSIDCKGSPDSAQVAEAWLSVCAVSHAARPLLLGWILPPVPAPPSLCSTDNLVGGLARPSWVGCVCARRQSLVLCREFTVRGVLQGGGS